MLAYALMHRHILNDRVNQRQLTRNDTTNTPAYYDVKIPKAFLSIESWEELIRNQRLLVDSLSIEQPDIVIHDYRVRKPAQKHAEFHTSMILENLQKTLDRLHARSIAINNASLTPFTRRRAEPLAVRDVTLRVRNFLKIDNNDRHLFGSDDIELTLGRQRLLLADGKNSLSFAAMRFRSATQSFEIDSVYFLQPATAERGETSLRADKFFFNSSRIPTIYQKSILSLDTLVCVRPVLRLPLNAPKKTAPKDTSIHSGIKACLILSTSVTRRSKTGRWCWAITRRNSRVRSGPIWTSTTSASTPGATPS